MRGQWNVEQPPCGTEYRVTNRAIEVHVKTVTAHYYDGGRLLRNSDTPRFFAAAVLFVTGYRR